MNTTAQESTLTRATALLIGFALFKLLLHLVTNIWGGYGYFRDELYYIACSEHLAAGYVDHPPFSVFLLAISRWVFGDSLFALRLFPAVAGAATVFLTGLTARELGGGKFAQLIAGTASIVSIIYLAYDTIYSMNAFDVLFWTYTAYVTIRLIKTRDARYWLLLGAVIGLGALNKIGMIWFAVGIYVGVLLTSQRAWFKTKWPYIAGVMAFVLFLPFIIWNVTHDFAHLEFIRNATGEKYASQTPLTFLVGQILVQNPITTILWVSGLVYLLFVKGGRDFRALGYAYLVPLIILLLNQHSKPEYLAPAYSILFASGGVALERWTASRFLGWFKPVYVGILVLGLVLAPLVLPILPVKTYIAYADWLGVRPSTSEGKKLEKLPQFYADMFGWREKVEAVAKVYQDLSPEDQAHCVIYASNYGRCSAIDFFGRQWGLPRAIGGHNNYWIWGPGSATGEVLIALGGRIEDYKERFATVKRAGTATCRYCMPYENNLGIFVCRNLTRPITEVWPQIKHYE